MSIMSKRKVRKLHTLSDKIIIMISDHFRSKENTLFITWNIKKPFLRKTLLVKSTSKFLTRFYGKVVYNVERSNADNI